MDWKLLKIAAKYHDLGKYSDGFQNVIHSHIFKIQHTKLENHPHNYLSVALIPFRELKRDFTNDDLELLALIVGYHHERERKPKMSEIEQIVENQLLKHIVYIQQEINLNVSTEVSRAKLKVLKNRNRIWAENLPLGFLKNAIFY